MDYHAIGLVEINSIAKGFEVCDAMAKTANVTVLVAKSICPGKYIVMIGGDVAAVRQSVEAGERPPVRRSSIPSSFRTSILQCCPRSAAATASTRSRRWG